MYDVLVIVLFVVRDVVDLDAFRPGGWPRSANTTTSPTRSLVTLANNSLRGACKRGLPNKSAATYLSHDCRLAQTLQRKRAAEKASQECPARSSLRNKGYAAD